MCQNVFLHDISASILPNSKQNFRQQQTRKHRLEEIFNVSCGVWSFQCPTHMARVRSRHYFFIIYTRSEVRSCLATRLLAAAGEKAYS